MGLQKRLFHKSLYDIIEKKLNSISNKKDKNVSEAVSLLKTLKNKVTKDNFDRFSEKYFSLFHKDINHEKILLDLFTFLQFQKLGLADYAFPKMLRGLPRVHKKDNPGITKLMPEYKNLFSLKKCYVQKPILSLYENIEIPKGSNIAILFGDTGLSSIRNGLIGYLKERYPSLEIDVIKFACKKEKVRFFVDDKKITKKGLVKSLKNKQVVLEFFGQPTVKDKLLEVFDNKGFPFKYIHLVDHSNRQNLSLSSYYSLGLCFLDLGMFFEENKWSFSEISRKSIFYTLLGKSDPYREDIFTYKMETRFCYCSMESRNGILLYLHSILQANLSDQKDVDILITDASLLKKCFIKSSALKKSIDFKKYRIKSVEIIIDEKKTKLTLQEEGVELRLINESRLSLKDLSILLSISDEPIGCTVNFGFSDAIYHQKVFFLEVDDQSSSCLKQLIAIARNRIPQYKATILYLTLLLQSQTSKMDGDYVEEEYFQPSLHLDYALSISRLGKHLSHPPTIKGLKALVSIVVKEYSANQHLCNLITREIKHFSNPSIEKLESIKISEFILSFISFSSLVNFIREKLN